MAIPLFYDILTNEGQVFKSNHAGLLMLATADSEYFSDEGGCLNFPYLSTLAQLIGGQSITVGGVGTHSGGTFTPKDSFKLNYSTLLDVYDQYDAVLFSGSGNGIVSFSASTGARSYADFVGADRKISFTVKGTNDVYGVRAEGSLTVKGDAAAKFTMRNGATNRNSSVDYFPLEGGSVYKISYDTAAYRAAGSLLLKKDFTGTIDSQNTSFTMKLAEGSYGLTQLQSGFISANAYTYDISIVRTGLRAAGITITGEINSHASISTSIKDVDITLYSLYYAVNQPPYIPKLLSTIESVGILSDGDITLSGEVSGGNISASLKNVVFRMGTGSVANNVVSINDGSEIYYFEPDDNKVMSWVTGIKGDNITVKKSFAPDQITITAENIKQSLTAAGVYAENRLDVAGDLAGKITMTINSVETQADEYDFDADFHSRLLGAGILADKISVAGEIKSNININVSSSGSSDTYFYAYGIKASSIVTDRLNANITITGASQQAAGIGVFVRDGISASGSCTVAGNITVTGNHGIGIMGFGVQAVDLLVTGSISAQKAIIAGYIDPSGSREVNANFARKYRVSVLLADYSQYFLFGTNDKVELAAGASVNGIVDLGDGQNVVTIDSNATLVGRIDSTLGTVQTIFKLNGAALDGAIVTLSGHCSLTESVGSIHVAVDNAEVGTYKLINASAVNNVFSGQSIAVTYKREDYLLVIDGGALQLTDTLSVEAKFNGGMVEFTVSGETEDVDRKISGITEKVDQRNSQIVVNWDRYSASGTYTIDYEIVEDGVVASSGTINNIDGTSYTFDNIAANQQIRGTISVSGDAGTGTAFESEKMPELAMCTITAMSQGKLFNTSVKDLLYSLEWQTDARNSLPLSYYEIQYIENSNVVLENPDWGSANAVTKYSTDTSLVISGLRDNSGFWWRARAVDINGNASEWSRSKYVNTGNDNTAPTIDLTRVASGSSFDIDTGRISAWIEWPLAEDDSAGVESYQLDVENVFGEKFEFSISILQSELLSGEEVVRNIAEDITVKYKMDRRTGIARCVLDLPNGSYNWKVSVADFCGNVNTGFAVGNEKGGNWVGDIVAPEFTAGVKAVSSLMYDEEAKSYYNHVTLSWGRAKDNKGDRAFEKYEVVMSGENNLETVIAVIDDIRVNSYEFDSTQTGNYKFYVRAYDRFGNVSQTDNAPFVVDFTPPTGKLTKMSAPVISAQWNDYDVEEFVVATSSLETLSTQKVYTYYVSDVSITLNFTANFVDDLSSVKYQVELSNNEQFISQDKNVTRRFTVDAKTGSNYTLTLDGDSAGTGMAAGLLLGMDKIYYRIRAVDEVGNATIWHDYQASTGEKYFKLQAPFSSDSDDPNKPTGITRITDGRKPSAPSSLKVTVSQILREDSLAPRRSGQELIGSLLWALIKAWKSAFPIISRSSK